MLPLHHSAEGLRTLAYSRAKERALLALNLTQGKAPEGGRRIAYLQLSAIAWEAIGSLANVPPIAYRIIHGR